MSQLHKHAARLSEIAAQKRELQLEEDQLKQHLLQEMKAEGIKSYKSDFGSVSHVTRRRFKYSQAVRDLEDQVGLKKIEEEERGIAEVAVTEFVQVKLHNSHEN